MPSATQLRAVDIPDQFSGSRASWCWRAENDAYPALDMAAMNRLPVADAFARIIPVRCLGSVNTIWISDALSSGYDGVMLMGLPEGRQLPVPLR